MAGTRNALAEKRDEKAGQGGRSWRWRRKKERERERERVESLAGRGLCGARVGEGSNVIQIAGNLSQKQLGCTRARETADSSITSPCIGIGDRTFLNNRCPARAHTVCLSAKSPRRAFCREERIFALEHYTTVGWFRRSATT